MNFGIFVLALFVFRFLLHGLIAFSSQRTADGKPSRGDLLPEWAMLLLGYSVFWWVALQVETPWDTTPDLAVLACVCLTAGIILRLGADDRLPRFVLFGFVLGIGYWTKAILFPLGFVCLAAVYLWKRSIPGWRRRVLAAGLVFLFVSAPLIILLSSQKKRFTFGDSGTLNYAWYVSPRTFWRNWQGSEPGSGTPLHPTRQLLRRPDLFEFEGPVVGTYPPWTDPSYWNDGLTWHFRLRPQLEVLYGAVSSEMRLLFRERPEVVVGVIILAILSGPMRLRV